MNTEKIARRTLTKEDLSLVDENKIILEIKNNIIKEADSDQFPKFWSLALNTGNGTRMNMVIFKDLPANCHQLVIILATRHLLVDLNRNALLALTLGIKEYEHTRVLVLNKQVMMLQKKLIDYFEHLDIDVDNESAICYVPHIILNDDRQNISDINNVVNLTTDWLL